MSKRAQGHSVGPEEQSSERLLNGVEGDAESEAPGAISLNGVAPANTTLAALDAADPASRARTVLLLQQQHGNGFVQRLLAAAQPTAEASATDDSGGAPRIQRAVDDPPQAAAPADAAAPAATVPTQPVVPSPDAVGNGAVPIPASAPTPAPPDPGPAPNAAAVAAVATPPAPVTPAAAPQAQAGPPPPPMPAPGAASADGAATLGPAPAVPAPPAPPALDGTSAATAATQRLIDAVLAAAAEQRAQVAARLPEAAESIAATAQQQQQSITDAANAATGAVQTSVASAHASLAQMVDAARARAVDTGQAQLAAVDQWHAAACARAQEAVPTHQAQMRTMGETYANEAITAADTAVRNAETQVRAAADQARALGQSKSAAQGSTPEAVQAKAKVAIDLGNNTADTILQGLTGFGDNLRNAGNDTATAFRQKANEAAGQLDGAAPPVIQQLDGVKSEAQNVIRQAVDAASAALTDLQTQLAAQLDQLGTALVNSIQTQANESNQQIDVAAQHASAALQQQGQAALSAADDQVGQFVTQAATLSVDPTQVDAAVAEAVGQVTNGFAALGTEIDTAVATAGDGLNQAGTGGIGALNSAGSEAEGQLQNFLSQAQAQVDQQVTEITGQLEGGTPEATASGDNIVDELVRWLDGRTAELEQAFEKDRTDYQNRLDGEVNNTVNQANTTLAGLEQRITEAQARVEAAQSQSWLGRQLSQLGSMLSDPGFWAGLVVGLALGLVAAGIIAVLLLGGWSVLAVIGVAFLLFAVVGAIAALVGTIVSNWHHGKRGWALFDNVLKNMLIGAIFGGVLGALGTALSIYGASLLATVVVLSLVAGLLTIIINKATGRPWDENLLANMLLVGLLTWAGGKFFGGGRGAPEVPPEVPPEVRPTPIPDVPVDPAVKPPPRPGGPEPEPPPQPEPEPVPPRPAEYDPTTRTLEQLQGDRDPTPRAGETPEEAAARARAAEEELARRRAEVDALEAARAALLGRIQALLARAQRIMAQAREIPEQLGTRDPLVARAQALTDQLNALHADTEIAANPAEIHEILTPEADAIEGQLNTLQNDVNAANIPRPTPEGTTRINRHTEAMNQLRDALHNNNQEQANAARATMDAIEAEARAAHNVEGSPLSRLLDQLQSMIDERANIEHQSAQGSWAYPMEDPPGSGNFVEGMGRHIDCAASRVGPLAGRTYAEIRAMIGRDPVVSDSAAGRTRLTWEFADGSEIHIDVPGPDNTSPFEVSRTPHAGRTGPTPHNLLHLSDSGIAVPSDSAPAHIPIVADSSLSVVLNRGR